MPVPTRPASSPSATSDYLRLAIPLTIITAATIATLWIDRGSFAANGATSAASAVASAQPSR
jgi:hypothetical protein